MCGGNASTALDFEPLARELKFANDAFLLVDYPSYGACAGQPSPAAIRANIKTAIPAAAKIVKIDAADFPTSVLAFGHSLGCSAALMAVEEFKLRSAVLCAPFTSTREMAKEKFYIADEVPLAHLYDNRPGLKALAAAKGRAWIFHGDQDDVIPATMSKTLAAEFKDWVTLKMVARADHNDLIARDLEAWKKAMADARK
jgi:pimeloyl-ACP methyl ester carboxylesterase